MGDDALKKIAAEIKAKVEEKEEAEINEEAFDEAFGAAEKTDEGSLGKDAAFAFLVEIYSKL